MLAAILVIAAYLCGSLPTGVWFGHLAGIDVRQSGSGNIGATNVARTVGVMPALLTLIGDVAKGFLPVLLARTLMADMWIPAVVGLAAFLGHIFSVFLRFSGGKGVATGFGVFLALAPATALICATLFIVVVVWTRYVSLASIVGAVALPLASIALGHAVPVSLAALLVCAGIVARHGDNLSRLRTGNEPRFRARGSS